MRAATLGALIVVSCGGQRPVLDQRPRGYAELMSDADRHEQKAEHHDRAAAELPRASPPENYACGDSVLNDQQTTGAEPITTWMPCWDPEEEALEAHRNAAAHERRAAREERAEAVALARAELASCRGIPPRELAHSPLAHRKAIAEVIPHDESGEPRGVHIIFRQVPGLNARWMERAIACHRARAAVLGQDGGSPDPTLVPGAEVTVTETGGRVSVYIRTVDSDSGALALARARALAGAQTATR